MELAEDDLEVGHVAQREPHRDEVEASVGEGERLGHPLHGRDLPRELAASEHADRRVEPDDAPTPVEHRERLARDEPGADRDVEHTHSRGEPRAPQRPASIPGPGAERHEALDAVVVPRGRIEDPPDERAPLLFPAVVLGERRMGGVRNLVLGRDPHAPQSTIEE